MTVISVRIEEDRYGETFMQIFNDTYELHDKIKYISPEGVTYSIKSTAVVGEILQK